MGSADCYSQLEYAQMLKKSGQFNEYPICDKEAAPITRRIKINNSKAQKELGIQFTPIETTLVDMGKALIQLGIVKKQ